MIHCNIHSCIVNGSKVALFKAMLIWRGVYPLWKMIGHVHRGRNLSAIPYWAMEDRQPAKAMLLFSARAGTLRITFLFFLSLSIHLCVRNHASVGNDWHVTMHCTFTSLNKAKAPFYYSGAPPRCPWATYSRTRFAYPCRVAYLYRRPGQQHRNLETQMSLSLSPPTTLTPPTPPPGNIKERETWHSGNL